MLVQLLVLVEVQDGSLQVVYRLLELLLRQLHLIQELHLLLIHLLLTLLN